MLIKTSAASMQIERMIQRRHVRTHRTRRLQSAAIADQISVQNAVPKKAAAIPRIEPSPSSAMSATHHEPVSQNVRSEVLRPERTEVTDYGRTFRHSVIVEAECHL